MALNHSSLNIDIGEIKRKYEEYIDKMNSKLLFILGFVLLAGLAMAENGKLL